MTDLTKQNVRMGIVLALSAALISGVSNFLSKIAVTAVNDPVVYTTLKNGLVALALIGICAATGVVGELRRLNRRQALTLAAIGIIGGSVPFILYFTGLKQTSAISAALIHKSMFLWVLLLAVPLLKEKIRPLLLAGVAVLFAANLLVGGFQGFQFNAGELMILAATVLWAVENVIAKKVLVGVSSRLLAAARMGIGVVILAAVSATRGGFSAVAAMTPAAWGWTLLTSLLLLGFVLSWYAALKKLPATLTAALLVPATLVTNLLTAGLLKHQFGALDAMSAIAFVAGTVFVVVYARQANKNATASPAAV